MNLRAAITLTCQRPKHQLRATLWDRVSFAYLTRNYAKGIKGTPVCRSLPTPWDPEYKFGAECTRLDPRCWALCGNQIKSTLSPGTWRANFYIRWRVSILHFLLSFHFHQFPWIYFLWKEPPPFQCPRSYPSRATLRTLQPAYPRTTRRFS